MFVDEVTVQVRAGNGGNGMSAFRREKYVPKGGPAGGDGGNGGNIIFKVDEGLSTLLDFRYNRHFRAKHGENGMSKGKHGRNAEDLIIPVPPGTSVYNALTNELIADLVDHDEEAIIVNGGRGGRGNIRFATSRNPAPNISENGEPGEEIDVRLELKVLADVGLVGFPSVGKSTLLSVVSKARPKVADYHFTTLQPNLGVVSVNDGRSFVMADLPGLIEGAHEGVGLGIQFLRHVERTRLIVHLIDMASTDGRDPYEDYKQINFELSQYDRKLEDKKQIVVANKMDMPNAQENLKLFKSKISNEIEVFPISAVTREGLKDLLIKIANDLEEIPKITHLEDEEDLVVYKQEDNEPSFEVNKDLDGAFVLSGEKIEKLFLMTNFSSDEAVNKFARTLRHMGVDAKLRDLGAVDGDTIRILDYEFEFVE